MKVCETVSLNVPVDVVSFTSLPLFHHGLTVTLSGRCESNSDLVSHFQVKDK
jgi:hypothetical protein